MNDVITTVPASAISFATSLTRRMFSDAILRGEAEIRIQAVAQVIAIEHVGVHRALKEFLLERSGNRRLPGAGKSGEPDDGAAMPISSRSPLRGDLAFVPENILALDLFARSCKRRRK